MGKEKMKNKIIFLACFTLSFSLAGLLAVKAENVSDLTFECLETQQCCKNNYNAARSWGLIQGVHWDYFKIKLGNLSYSASQNVKKFDDMEVFPGQDPVPNVSLGDRIQGEIVLQGEWIPATGGYMDTPPINIVGDIDDYLSSSDPDKRRCGDPTANFKKAILYGPLCPNSPNEGDSKGQSRFDMNPYYSSDGTWFNVQGFCEAYPESYLDEEFGLPTYLTYYPSYRTFGGGGSEGACIGTQVNCDFKETSLDTEGPISCTALTWDSEQNKYTFTCTPTGAGQAKITLNYKPRCFVYAEKGIFQRTITGFMFKWLNIGSSTSCGLDNCWCENLALGQGIKKYCSGLFYPFEMTQPLDLPEIASSTYTLDFVDSRCVIDPVKVWTGDLPTAVPFTVNYDDMYSGEHEGTRIAGFYCGSDFCNDNNECVEPVYQLTGCEEPDQQNPQGKCYFTCSYPEGMPEGIYHVSVKLENEAKFAVEPPPEPSPLPPDPSVEPPPLPPDPPILPPDPLPSPLPPGLPPNVVIITDEPDNWPSSLSGLSVIADTCFAIQFHPTFSWNYSDPEGDEQSAYQLQIDMNNNGDFEDGNDFDSGVVQSSSNSYTVNSRWFDYDTNYNWRVKVASSPEGDPQWTDWAESSFSQEEWPWPEFEYQINGGSSYSCAYGACPPAAVSKGDQMDLSNKTRNCSGGCDYEWIFGDGATSKDASPSFSHLFQDLTQNYAVKLKAMDSSNRNHSCTLTLQAFGGMPPPKWKEISPPSI